MIRNRPNSFRPQLISGVVARTPQQLEAMRRHTQQPVFRPLVDDRRPAGKVRPLVPQPKKAPQTA